MGASGAGLRDGDLDIGLGQIGKALVVIEILTQRRDFLGRNPAALIGARFPDLVFEVRPEPDRAAGTIRALAVFLGEGTAFHGLELPHLLKNGGGIAREIMLSHVRDCLCV